MSELFKKLPPPEYMVLDFETRSGLKLGSGGTNAVEYAKHPSTDIWLLGFTNGDRPLDRGTKTVSKVWAPNRYQKSPQMPPQLREHIARGGKISAHNAGFEWAIWNYIMVPRYGWLPLKIENMSDTAARAARMGLSRALEKCAPALNCMNQKDLGGKTQMKAMAKPRNVFKVMEADIMQYLGDKDRYTCVVNDWRQQDEKTLHDWIVYEWWSEPDRIQHLGGYCLQDVVTQLELHQKLPELPEKEFEIWQATMQANIRGCRLDLDFVKRACEIINYRINQFADDLQGLTGGAVSSHTDLNGMKRWMESKGIKLKSLDKQAIQMLLDDPATPDEVRKVASIRQQAGKSSVAKYPAMLRHAGLDGISHDQLVYYGAQATGRWSAQGWQLHNLPSRGAVSYKQAEWAIRMIKRMTDKESVIDLLESVLEGSVIEILSMCLRGAIQAREGYEINCADYSNIEGRVAAWFGDEQWKLNAFREYDAGTGPDLYKVTAAMILGTTPDNVDKVQRNVLGKVSELALGFQGGVGAYVSMGANYGVDMADYADIIKSALHDYWEKAVENYNTFGKQQKTGLVPQAWCASESVKLAWRDQHPGIRQSWYDAEAAAMAAIKKPGSAHSFCNGKLSVLAKSIEGKLFLLLRLPSGRCIHYANVRISRIRTSWGEDKQGITFDKVESGRVFRSGTYGGDIFQSAVQGTARDIMAHGWLNTVHAGYEGLFSVHDEMASEVEKGLGNLDEYTSLLCDIPEWAAGCPVTASGYVSDRFRKD